MSNAEVIKNYNYFLTIIFQLFTRIIAANDEKNIQYVCFEGEMVASYKIWSYEFSESDSVYNFSLNLLCDGRLICVSRCGLHRKDKPTDLYYVKSTSEMFFVQVDCIYCTLADIYNSIYVRRNDFGITFDSDWPKRATDFYISHL